MSKTTRIIYAVSFFITATGYLLPFWPLCLAGLAFAALSGRYLFAVVIGLLIDIATGVPTGILHYLYFPFTLFAVVVSLLYVLSARYFLDRSGTGTL